MKESIRSIAAAALFCALALPAFGGGSGEAQPAAQAEKVTIRYMTQDHANYPIKGDAPVFQELMKRTGLNIVFETTPSANYVDKRNIVIASGDLPDIMFIYARDAIAYGQKGIFTPLNDLIDTSPSLKGLLTPEIVIDAMGLDGNIYSIPMINDVPNLTRTLLGRKDWMDKLGLQEPQTMDELYAMLSAFRDKMPAMVGKSQVYPMVNTSGLQNIIDTLSYCFDTRKEWNTVGGRCVYAPVTPEYKSMLMFVRKLYENGLLDKEYATLSTVQWEEKMSSGLAGSSLFYVARADSVTPKLKKVVPEGEIVIMALPKGPRGSRGVIALKTNVDNCLAISASSKHIKESFKLLDYMYGPEGTLLLNYGIEGVTYDMKDGKPVYKQEVLEDVLKASTVYNGAAKYGMAMTGQAYNRMYSSLLDLGVYGPQFRKSIHTLDGLGYLEYPEVKYTKEQQDRVKAILSAVRPLKEEYENKFVMGLVSFDQWDKYVAELKKFGTDEYEQILNGAYLETKRLMDKLR